MQLFGKNIQFLRKQCGFTQGDMTKHIEVTRVTWSNYENNVSEPDLEKLYAIAKLFGVTTDQLLSSDLTKDESLNIHFNQYLKEQQILNSKNYLPEPIQGQGIDKNNIDNQILSKLNELAENMEMLKKGLL